VLLIKYNIKKFKEEPVNYLKYKNILIIPSILLALMILIPFTALADDTAKIKKELDSSDWQVRLKAVEKLANRSDEEAVNLLLSVAGTRTEYWPVKIEAMLLLGETKDQRAKKLLLSIFHDPNLNWECPSIKTHAVIALGNFKGDPYIVESLIKALDDHEKMTREAGIQSLGKIGDPAAVPHIIESLNEPSFAVKLSAIEALEAIGDPQAIAPLQRVAENDSDDLIRLRAQEAIDTLKK
jgi:HEAT repeat protein